MRQWVLPTNDILFAEDYQCHLLLVSSLRFSRWKSKKTWSKIWSCILRCSIFHKTRSIINISHRISTAKQEGSRVTKSGMPRKLQVTRRSPVRDVTRKRRTTECLASWCIAYMTCTGEKKNRKKNRKKTSQVCMRRRKHNMTLLQFMSWTPMNSTMNSNESDWIA